MGGGARWGSRADCAANGIAAISLDVRRLTDLVAEEDSAVLAHRRDL
jgi:hypothetical protein